MFEAFDRPVRCKAGHVFTTIWIPMASLKAIRLGMWRFQYCPVGRHWTGVVLLNDRNASLAELQQAATVHDARIP